MQRTIVGSIYGYLICLIAVLVIFRSAAGITSSIVGMASPTPMGSGAVMRTFPGERSGVFPRMPENFVIRSGNMPGGRLFAIRGFFVSLVLLVIAIFLFRWHWRRLHGESPNLAT